MSIGKDDCCIYGTSRKINEKVEKVIKLLPSATELKRTSSRGVA